MSPKTSPKIVAYADVVSFMAVLGKVHDNEAVKFELVSFLDIRTDCVIDLGIPSGSTNNVFKTLSPA